MRFVIALLICSFSIVAIVPDRYWLRNGDRSCARFSQVSGSISQYAKLAIYTTSISPISKYRLWRHLRRNLEKNIFDGSTW